MEIIEIKSILPHLIGAIPIGFGTTAVCYLKPNNEVLKIFYNSANTRKLFSSYDMLEHLKFLSTLTCSSYDGPTKILLKNGKVIGYIYPYIYMQTLSKLPNYTSLANITNGYGKLLSDVKKMSNTNFRLFDVHHKNILFGKNYKLIDIDKGYQDLNSNIEDIFIYNMRQINKTIIEEIFKLKIDEHLLFEDETIRKYYLNTLYEDPYQIYDLLGKLFYNCDSIKDVQNKVKIKIYKEEDSYHKTI